MDAVIHSSFSHVIFETGEPVTEGATSDALPAGNAGCMFEEEAFFNDFSGQAQRTSPWST